MKARTNYCAREIANEPWIFTANDSGTMSYQQIQTATLLCVRDELRAINNKLDALGIDGIHQLIREQLREVRAARRARLQAARDAKAKGGRP